MSHLIYSERDEGANKPVVWLHGEVRTPPMSLRAKVKVGLLLRQLQHGDPVGMPQSRPMNVVGPRCHELRVADGRVGWRVMYRIDSDAVIILEVFRKKTSETPQPVIEACRDRLRRYDQAARGEGCQG